VVTATSSRKGRSSRRLLGPEFSSSIHDVCKHQQQFRSMVWLLEATQVASLVMACHHEDCNLGVPLTLESCSVTSAMLPPPPFPCGAPRQYTRYGGPRAHLLLKLMFGAANHNLPIFIMIQCFQAWNLRPRPGNSTGLEWGNHYDTF